ncbi:MULTISPECIES: class II glutamine amidotransferase [Mameliella]|uniref:Putative Glutamine amidotransferase, class II n=1 Tax=Mameliella alba TaxID=561184 RepID=A0A0B3RF87_9RHOB|nr:MULTISPECIES: glutamine amidotransferase family protein [Mameliella]ODM48965.1 glutamine amidotransferase [Ruegeria sp. PBVC088]KHQ49900.1 putative Glutamine amidotransferase, class II [Mameliella alba]MBY6118235.1 glutamine amidotransferase family protein [Mameliella alba]MDD9733380.1 glutamine amidotransferase family protein [Mameliella sp. AT18]OWV43482.1 glutamine amidotransferase [Mameliella alba]
MCGIVGLFLKDKALEPQLGALLTDMLITMTDRGPDSAGIAIYGAEDTSASKLTVQAEDPDTAFDGLADKMAAALGGKVTLTRNDTHAVLQVPAGKAEEARTALREIAPEVRAMSFGDTLEIYKEVGLPKDVAARFDIAKMSGTHGIGHTRMATESAVTTLGAHPFNTGSDQCLVHNGSLSNHNSLRRKLQREGIHIETQNDTEVGAAYLTWKMQNGATLGEALEASLEDLDGFFNFVVGTKDGFGVVRDPIACKPAVMAETDQYVAFGSEYRALVNLPGIETARVWEPEPATVYFWTHDQAPNPKKKAA